MTRITRLSYRWLLLCVSAAQIAVVPAILAAQERPWYVTPCELMQHPDQVLETLVTVPGLVMVNQGELTMHGYDCYDEHVPLRLEFGGQRVDPKDRFRTSRERLEAAAVPLKKDADYERFEKLLEEAAKSPQPKMFRATLTGRLFVTQSASKGKTPGPQAAEPRARLVISEVQIVADELEAPVDFSPMPSLPPPSGSCASTELPLPYQDDVDKLQRNSLRVEFAYLHDPRQVAVAALAAAADVDKQSVAASLQDVSSAPADATYRWATSDGNTLYTVTVNKPYWLLQTAVSGDAVIWAPKRLVRTQCGNPSKH